jgi:DNA-binding beta-propeller fold protein YncE
MKTSLPILRFLALCLSAPMTCAQTIITLAGNGTQGYSGDNGPATAAQLSGPKGVAVDPTGNIYIADEPNNCVRKVDAGTHN